MSKKWNYFLLTLTYKCQREQKDADCRSLNAHRCDQYQGFSKSQHLSQWETPSYSM